MKINKFNKLTILLFALLALIANGRIKHLKIPDDMKNGNRPVPSQRKFNSTYIEL